MTEIDDKKVVFVSSHERIIHVHRTNIVNNVKGEWTRPTILIAAEGQTPVFCAEVHVRGDVRIVERPPGVHMVVDDAAVLTALDTDRNPIELPSWAHPSKRRATRKPIELRHEETQKKTAGGPHHEARLAREARARTLGGAPDPRPLTDAEREEVAGLYGGGPRKLEEFQRGTELFHLDPEGYADALNAEASRRQGERDNTPLPVADELNKRPGSVEDAPAGD